MSVSLLPFSHDIKSQGNLPSRLLVLRRFKAVVSICRANSRNLRIVRRADSLAFPEASKALFDAIWWGPCIRRDSHAFQHEPPPTRTYFWEKADFLHSTDPMQGQQNNCSYLWAIALTSSSLEMCESRNESPQNSGCQWNWTEFPAYNLLLTMPCNNICWGEVEREKLENQTKHVKDV